MRVMYNVTGNRRKELVKAVGEAVGIPPRYLGAPSFAYEIGSYEIDRDGTLAAPVGHDSDAFDRLLGQLWLKGFQYGERVGDEAASPEAAPEGAPDAPSDTVEPEAPPEEPVPTPPTPEGSTLGGEGMTIILPMDGITEAKLNNLRNLIHSKRRLIMKSLGAFDTSITNDDERIYFKWFDRDLDGFEIQAYAHFIEALYDTAKRQQRVSAAERDVDSERFAFRIFLLRLGFGGAEYAAERKLLLRNLSGPSAFPNTAKAAQHTDRWRERREQQQAAQLPSQTGVDVE